jgi:mannose-6-phosphate isomerase class I
VRRKIDGLPEGAPSGELQTREAELRSQMDDYSHLRPLCPGDVVKVPLLTPHALQHGVRTVEFQTPVYERKILSFAQKVLTQDHWDTEEAVAQMQLEAVEEEAFDCLVNEDDLRVERIVDFSDFEVRRVCLAGGGSLDVEPLPLYGLIMVVEGELEVAGSAFGPEQAFILPRGWTGQLAALKPASSLVFLLALPRH